MMLKCQVTHGARLEFVKAGLRRELLQRRARLDTERIGEAVAKL